MQGYGQPQCQERTQVARFKLHSLFAVVYFLILLGVWRVDARTLPQVSVVKVLVIFTPQAATNAGGTEAMLSQINFAIVEANTVFQNSAANVRIRLVQASQVNYAESGSVASDLARLDNPNDVVFGPVHRLQAELGADLVCMVTETGSDYDFYGLQGPSSENAYSVIRLPFLTGSYCFPVTLSFNFGCQLERPYADSPGAFPYAYGYSFSTTNGFYSTADAFSGQRLPYFSNPNILFQGVPMGIPEGQFGSADNALVLNHTAPIVAGFAGTSTQCIPPFIQLTLPTNGTTVNAGTGLALDALVSSPSNKVVKVDYYAGTNLLASTVGKHPGVIASAPAVGDYTVFAVATDSKGASTISTSVQIIVRPENDDFNAATPLYGTNVNILGTTFNATFQPGESNWNNGNPSVWYTWTASADGDLAVQISKIYNALSYTFFSGHTLDHLTAIPDNTATLGDLTYPVTRGQTYHLLIYGQTPTLNFFELSLFFYPIPPNDNFANRVVLPNNGETVYGNNFIATFQLGEPEAVPNGYFPSQRTVWWTWQSPADGNVTFNANCDFSFLLDGYSGNTLSNLSLLVQSPGSLNVTKGEVVQIQVDGINGGVGNIALNSTFLPAPSNEIFSGRNVLTGTDISVTNLSKYAAIETNLPVDNNGMNPTLWWSWTAPTNGCLNLSCPSGQFLDVFTGNSLKNLVEVTNGNPVFFQVIGGTNYTIAATGPPGEVDLDLIFSTLTLSSPTNGRTLQALSNATLNVSYTRFDGDIIQVEYFANGNSIGVSTNAPFSLNWTNNSDGNYNLYAVGTDSNGVQRVSPQVSVAFYYPQPSNDDFTNRTVIVGNWIDVNETVDGATAEPGDPQIGGSQWARTLWWSWTAPYSGSVTINTGFTYSMGIAVCTGNSLSNLNEIVSGPWAVNFNAVGGTTYAICGASWWPDFLQFELTLTGLHIANPADGSTFTTGVNLPISAMMPEAEGPVSQVEFFENGTSLGVVSNAPYSMVWSNTPGGTFSLTAASTDVYGHTRTSPAISISVQPANEYFTNAIQLTGNTVHTNGSSAGAIWLSGDPVSYITYWGPFQASSAVWYSWTAPQTGLRSIVWQTDWTFNQLFSVFTGTDVNNLTLITNSPGWSVNYLSAIAGTTYFIALDADNPGNFTLDITIPPTNDNFANRITITNANTMIYGNNLGAGAEPGEPGLSFYSVWWDWTAPQDGILSFSISDSFSPTLHVYSGSSLTNLSLLPGQYGYLWDNPRNFAFEVDAGTNYVFEADFQWSSDWSIEFMPVFQSRPANDNFTNAFAVSGTTVSTNGNNTLATSEPGEPKNGGSTAGHSVWYTWTAPAQGFVAITVSSTNFSPALAVYTGNSFSNFTTVGTAWPGTVSFMTTAGASYNIAVDGPGGNFSLGISLTVPPLNDNFASRIALNGLNATTQGQTFLATFEPGETNLYPYIVTGTVWYSWIAPANGIAHVACPSNPVWIFSGNNVTNLTLITFNDYFLEANYVVFPVVAGNEYEIAVGGGQYLSDDFTLSISMAKAQIISPTNGSFFPAPASFPIIASTINIDGNVVSLDFYDGTNLLATVTNAPFQINYTNVPEGSHELSLQARDENGMTTTSEVVEVRSQPTNDDFAQRFTISCMPATIVAANDGATTEPGEQLPEGATGRTLWWTWTAISNGTVTIYSTGFSTSPNTVGSVVAEAASSRSVITISSGLGPAGPTTGPLVAVYTNAALTNLVLISSNSVPYATIPIIDPITGDFEPGISWYLLPAFSFQVVAGQTYQISLDGVNGSYGTATMNFSFAPPPSPPPNDNFANRIPMTGSLPYVNGTTALATREPGEPLEGADTNSRTVWYSWTAPSSGDAELSEADSFSFYGWSSSMNIAVYTGSQLNNLTPVAIATGGVSFYAQAGTTYQIVVVGPEGLGTGFVLGFDEAPPLPPAISSSQSTMLHDRGFQISMGGITGQSFVVEASSDLVHWETIWTDTILGTNCIFIDADATILPKRFYRAMPLQAIYYQAPLELQAEPIASNAKFSFTMTGTAGQVYLIQASTNLVDWIDLTNGILSGDRIIFTDPDTAHFDRRFYRAVKQ